MLVPLGVVALVEVLSDSVLDEALPFPGDTLLVLVVVALAAIALARWAFRWIDRLTGELARRNAELERRDATLRALHRLSLAITATADLPRVLQLVVEQAVALLPADAAVLTIDRGPVEITAGETVLLDAATTAARLEAPLQRGQETIGTLAVASRASRVYGAEEVEALASLANQAAIAIEQARLQERLRELAVTQERERIAREMHDGLAQVLGYVNTKSQAVERMLDTGRVSDARSQLDQLAAAARSIYVDVREAILGLRSSIEPGEGLVGAVRAYAARFADASKLAVVVSGRDARSGPIDPDAGVGPEAADEVLRIVQEALTNVRKHAGAQRAEITLQRADGELVVTVDDDGRGMVSDATEADWPHYGLSAMRERAARIGGTIEWRPSPLGGTRVRLVVPAHVPASVPA